MIKTIREFFRWIAILIVGTPVIGLFFAALGIVLGACVLLLPIAILFIPLFMLISRLLSDYE